MTASAQIHGCLWGGAIGDALGAPIEFLPLVEIKSRFGERGVTDYVEFDDGTGAITDDTQMLLFTAEGLLLAGKSNPVKAVYAAYLRWRATQQNGEISRKNGPGWLLKQRAMYAWRAPGKTCLDTLLGGEMGTRKKRLNHSKGCGTVMRVAPVGLLYAPAVAAELGGKISAITHGHSTGIIAGAALAWLIAQIMHGASLPAAVADLRAFLATYSDEASETLAKLSLAVQLANADLAPCAALAQIGMGWVAEEALAIAIFCALRYENDFVGGVLAAVNIDGDSDSVGAITGNILGAVLGESAIPEKWITQLREREIIAEIANLVIARVNRQNIF